MINQPDILTKLPKYARVAIKNIGTGIRLFYGDFSMWVILWNSSELTANASANLDPKI